MVELLPDKEDRLVLTPFDLISLKDAGLRGGAFAMRPINQSNFDSLLLSDPASWPPILVTLSTHGYVLIDGYHRWEVAKFLHLDRMIATCEAFASENDVIEAAFRANLTHGLKASPENKSDYAYWLHVTYPQMEQADIAKRVGITQSTVSKAIARREEEARKARQEAAKMDEKQQKGLLRKSCRTFARVALRFLTETESLDDTELLQTLNAVVKKSEDKAKLARIGRLLSSGEEQTTQKLRPLRLRQFVSPSEQSASEHI